MSDNITQPLTQWTLAEPGRLVLPHTKYEIRWTGTGSPTVWWDGRGIYAAANLADAKRCMAGHMRDLIECGIEP